VDIINQKEKENFRYSLSKIAEQVGGKYYTFYTAAIRGEEVKNAFDTLCYQVIASWSVQKWKWPWGP